MSDDVTANVTPERQVASYCNHDIERSGDAVTGKYNSSCAKMGVVANLVQDRKHLIQSAQFRQPVQGVESSYILMTCVRKNKNRKAAQGCNGTFPSHNPDRAPLLHSITLDEVRNNQYDEVSN